MPEILERPSAKSTFTQSKYRTLAEQLRQQIERGKLQPGDRLPSFVELRARYGATPTTANQVYGLLEQEGLIERRQGSGTFVIDRKRTLTGNIGFAGSAFSNSQRSPFYTRLMSGVQQVVEAAQQHLLYLGTEYSLNVDVFCKVDGVLICNIENPRPVLQSLPDGLPRVALLNINEGVTSVVADDHGGSKMAVKHLASLGHQRIACLMEKTPSLSRRRFAGYSDGLLEAGIEANPAWARLTQKVAMGEDREPYLEWARREMRLWLDEDFGKLNCTAIFVQNEMAAIGVMQILQQDGWKVPGDISVMGFDGTELCDYAMPCLTAMELPLVQIGAKAVEILNRQIAGVAPEIQTITLPVNLREGDSIAPPRI